MHGMHQDAVDPMQRTDRGRKTSFISRSGANKVVLASRSGQSQWGVSWRSFHERKRGVNVNRNHSPKHLGFYTPSVLKNLTFRTAARSPKYNIDLLSL
jgi:hypothetical protein